MSTQALAERSEVQTETIERVGTGRRLSKRQQALILSLHEQGKNCVEIGQAIGCAPSTVTRTLDAWVDTRPIARKLLEAGATKLVETVINAKDASTALKALGKLDVVREDQAQTGSQVVVMIGSQDSPIEPPIIEIAPISAHSPSDRNV